MDPDQSRTPNGTQADPKPDPEYDGGADRQTTQATETFTKPIRPRRSRARPKPSDTIATTIESAINSEEVPNNMPIQPLRMPADPFIEQAQIRVQQLLANSSTTSLRSIHSRMRTPTPKTDEQEPLFYTNPNLQSYSMQTLSLPPDTSQIMQVEVPPLPMRNTPSKTKLDDGVDASMSSLSEPFFQPKLHPDPNSSSKLAAAGSAPSRFEGGTNLWRDSNALRSDLSMSPPSTHRADPNTSKASVGAYAAAQVQLPASSNNSTLTSASQRSLPRIDSSPSPNSRHDGAAHTFFTPGQVPLPPSGSNVALASTSQYSLNRATSRRSLESKTTVASTATFAPAETPLPVSRSDVTLKDEEGVVPPPITFPDPYPSRRNDYDPAASTSTLASVRSNGSNKLKKKSSAILSDLNEERKRQREQNRDYFRTRVWDPALQRDFVGAVRLAHDDEDEDQPQRQASMPVPSQMPVPPHVPPTSESVPLPAPPTNPPTPPVQSRMSSRQSSERIRTKKEKHDSNRVSRTDVILQRAKARLLNLGPPPVPQSAPAPKPSRPVTWVDAGPAAEDWARAVQVALANLELRIAREDPYSFLRFLPGKRESIDLRAWRAEVRRTPEARLSALALGQAVPSSPFEDAFVAELLRENEEVMLRHNGTTKPGITWGEDPLAAADEEGGGYNRYSHQNGHRALPPIPVADDSRPERDLSEKEAVDVRAKKRQSKVGGQSYKSFSAYSYMDDSQQGCCSCFGFLSKKRE